MAIKGETLTITLTAWDTANNEPKTGDAANISAYVSKDGAAEAAASNSVSELDATNCPGEYTLDLTASEMNADFVLVTGTSSTADVVVYPVKVITEGGLLPANQPTVGADGHVEADVVEVSGDDTAADNIEAQYDGTGYIEDSAPATQEQIGNLTSGTAAINTSVKDAPDGFVITTGSNEANDEDSTHALDGTTHDLEDTGNTTDCYYIFDVGGNGTAVSITWWGYAQGNKDTYAVYAYDWGSSTWEQIDSLEGSNGTTVWSSTFELTNAHTGTGANLGEVRLRFYSTDGSLLATDRILCSYAVVTKSVGYARGAIWIDTNASNTNTEDYVDGTADNPVSTWAAALTLSGSMGIEHFEIANGSSITLTGNSDNYTLKGADWTLDLGGQSVTDMYVQGATISGTGTVSGGVLHCYRCEIGTATLGKAHLLKCGFTDTLTISDADLYIFEHCYAADTGGGPPSIDMGSGVADTTVGLRLYTGGIKVLNLGQSGTDKFTVQGVGRVTIDSTCSGGTLGVGGNMLITDNVSGGFSGTLNEDARIDVDQINAEVDTALTDYDAVVPADLPANFGSLNITAGGLVDVDDSTPIDANVTQAGGSAIQSTSGELHVRDSAGNTLNNLAASDLNDPSAADIADKVRRQPFAVSGDGMQVLEDGAEVTKDIDITLSGEYTGSEDISGADITWAILPFDIDDWSRDLDTIISEQALVTYTTGGGGVSVTDGAAGEFEVYLKAADTAALDIGRYWALGRITQTDGTQLGGPAEKLIFVAHS